MAADDDNYVRFSFNSKGEPVFKNLERGIPQLFLPNTARVNLRPAKGISWPDMAIVRTIYEMQYAAQPEPYNDQRSADALKKLLKMAADRGVYMKLYQKDELESTLRAMDEIMRGEGSYRLMADVVADAPSESFSSSWQLSDPWKTIQKTENGFRAPNLKIANYKDLYEWVPRADDKREEEPRIMRLIIDVEPIRESAIDATIGQLFELISRANSLANVFFTWSTKRYVMEGLFDIIEFEEPESLAHRYYMQVLKEIALNINVSGEQGDDRRTKRRLTEKIGQDMASLSLESKTTLFENAVRTGDVKTINALAAHI